MAAFNSSSDTKAVAEQARHLARLIKSRDPKMIVAGGHYASCAAEPLLANHPEIDVVVIHEGKKRWSRSPRPLRW